MVAKSCPAGASRAARLTSPHRSRRRWPGWDRCNLTEGPIVAIRIVRLGTDRLPGEGLRLGTVRRPPRGIRKTEYASKNFYDIWLPTLAPSPASVKQALTARSGREWIRFVKKYRKEMAATNESATLDMLAALSHHTDFSVG